jgi:hypothetical protein
VIRDVVEFLGLDDKTRPVLSPAELLARYDHVLETAIRLVRQMPADMFEVQLPNRPRSYRMLMHHIFQIPSAYLDTEEEGGTLSREKLGVLPPPEMRTSVAVADFGESVRRRLNNWWKRVADEDFTRPVSTYFGETSRHEMFERTVWHSTQHTLLCWNKPVLRRTARSASTTSAACPSPKKSGTRGNPGSSPARGEAGGRRRRALRDRGWSPRADP